MTPPVVALEGVTKRFGAFAANRGVTLAVGRGEVHALLGENGAGKSTLVKMLYGLLAPDEGVITIDGAPVTLQSPAEARRLGVGMVFQHFSLFDDLTALENIALGLDGEGATGALAARVETLSRDFGLVIDPRRPVWSLSAGEKQRIEIARCLLQNPRLIILDEPTSVLTPGESDALFATLRRLVAEGASVLFISHKLDEVRQHCTAATILRQGEVVARCDPRAETPASLARLMVGEAIGEVATAAAHRVGAPMLQARRVSTRPTDTHGVALDGVDLVVHAGEIVAVAGVAGNGQSELFGVLSGEDGPPEVGDVMIAGEDVTRQPINARRALGAAFTPEERLGHAGVGTATLPETLLLSWHWSDAVSRAGVIRWGAARRIAGEVVRRFDVRSSRPDPIAGRLSGGNLQKFVIGRELTRKPRLIVVNQPTWGIDAAAARAVRQALVDLAAEGVAILVISQDLDEVYEIADRIAVIAAGRLTPAWPRADAGRERVGMAMTASAGQSARLPVAA